MEISQAVKDWLVKNAGVKADASDEEFKKALVESLLSGKLTTAEHEKLKNGEQKTGESFADKFFARFEEMLKGRPASSSTSPAAPAASVDGAAGADAKGVAGAAAGATGTGSDRPSGSDKGQETDRMKAVKGFVAGSAGSGVQSSVRVVGVEERYSKSRTDLFYPEDHALAKQPVKSWEGRRMYHGSELDNAVAGAWFKLAYKCGGGDRVGIPPGLRMTDHDKELVQYAVHECSFTGLLNGEWEEGGAKSVNNRKLHEPEIKALLDDAVTTGSGGLEIVPIVFDDMIITYPLLYGELFPLVRLVDIARGRRIEGGIVSNVTFTSGTAEGTSISLLDTQDFIAAFDTTIYNAVGAIELGRDFMSDSPVMIGEMVTESYGRAAQKWLDEQVAVGDGSTEPEGIMNATGVTDNDWGADAATVSDYEGLLFGVGKEYRDQGEASRQVFCGNETSYQRARGISVGVDDQRRVFGMDHENYRLLNHPYKIVQAMTNQQIFFANMLRYRMYRRLGLNIRVTDQGKELQLKNLVLITARMRFGGQLEDPAAACLTDSAEA